MFLIIRPVIDGALLWLVLSLFASRKWETYDFQEVIKVAAVVAIGGFALDFVTGGAFGIFTIVLQAALAAVGLMHFVHLEQRPAIKIAAIWMGVKLVLAFVLIALFASSGGVERIE